jgi:hypothetical protein
MAFRNFIAATFGVLLITGCGAAQAETYQPGDYLLLDLQKAVLSPKLLGPSSAFEHVQIEARTDSKTDPVAAGAAPRAAAKAAPVAKATRSVALRQRPPARARVVRAHSNPLDANAADTRVQVWPCRSGGICSWQK